MRFAKLVFRAAGIFGLLVLPPMYFLEHRIGADLPPAITHPEYLYGFVGVGLAWQIAFLVIATDPARYQPLMPAAMVEKFSYGIAALALWLQGRLAAIMLPSIVIDLAFGVLFVVAYRRCLTDSEPNRNRAVT